MQTGIAMHAREITERVHHLNGIARCRCQRLVHIGDQRRRLQACTVGDGNKRFGKVFGVFLPGHEGARTGFDVHHQAVEPGGQLLGQN